MDNLEEALKLRDTVLESLKRYVGARSRAFQVELALRLGAAAVLTLVDIALTLREIAGYEPKEEEKEE